jgi:hypothetical protein
MWASGLQRFVQGLSRAFRGPATDVMQLKTPDCPDNGTGNSKRIALHFISPLVI